MKHATIITYKIETDGQHGYGHESGPLHFTHADLRDVAAFALSECFQVDPDSTALVQSYRSRHHGEYGTTTRRLNPGAGITPAEWSKVCTWVKCQAIPTTTTTTTEPAPSDDLKRLWAQTTPFWTRVS